jgi:uncharacterized membrane protein YgdD (TMEM256/DUF423 family)
MYSHGMDRTFLRLGATLAMLSVGFGAFGAHLLKERLSSEMLTTWETAARYQMYHALALLAVGLLLQLKWDINVLRAGWLFTAGIILFSGSLYMLALTEVKILGAITPLGGLAFLSGWALLIFSVGDQKSADGARTTSLQE